MPSPSGFRYQTFEDPQDDFGVDEAFLRQVVAPTPAPAPIAAPVPAPAPASFNPVGFDWSQGVQNIGGTIYQPQFDSVQLGHGEEGGMWGQGALQNVLRYKEGQTAPGQTYELLDPTTGKVVGTGKFKEQSHGFFGDLWNLTSQAASDLAPILQYTPLGPAVQAINAINAAQQGDILPAVGTLAGIGGYTDVANAAKAVSAIKNEDYLGAVLPALQVAGVSDIGGYGTKEISDLLKVAKAIEQQNPLALISAASKYLPTETAGFMLPETADPTEFWYPSAPTPSIQTVETVTQIDPLKELQFQTGLTPDNQGFYLEEISSPVVPTPAQEPTPISAPERIAFLEANIPEPETVQELMQQYYPEIYETAPAPAPETQRVEVTGQRESPIEQTAFEQYMQQYAAPTEPPGMIEGPQTIEVTGKREPVLFPEFEQPLLTAEPMPAITTPTAAAPTAAPTAAAPTPTPTPAPTPSAPAKKQDDLGLLMLLASMMTPQQQAKDDYQLAQIGVASPYGIYGA